ncbi:NADH-ubiquinone oxidoreductase chain 4 [Trachymyrmex zeteki]|uniref:NADH-ubiquinone oxidoreductase chain 4 n=1 Tax=Mycetomoellerius zeteki TaxID=64791 RepID=A0A151WXR2_9HYME|nr:NADH-ubiquinone oxidoreductase chain 4 [Trachymyrmex zeteki]
MYIFHIWLPKAHVEAPVYGSIILAGVLLKIGRYGLIRFTEILYANTIKYGYLIIRVGVVGATLTSLTCLTQVDIKRMVAYSSVVHINLILCRLITLYKTRMLGRYIIIVAHGLCSSRIFYIVNIIYDRSNRRLLFLNKGSLRNIPAITI